MVGIHIAQLSAVSSVLPGSGPTSRRAFSRFTGFGASISAACPSITLRRASWVCAWSSDDSRRHLRALFRFCVLLDLVLLIGRLFGQSPLF